MCSFPIMMYTSMRVACTGDCKVAQKGYEAEFDNDPILSQSVHCE